MIDKYIFKNLNFSKNNSAKPSEYKNESFLLIRIWRKNFHSQFWKGQVTHRDLGQLAWISDKTSWIHQFGPFRRLSGPWPISKPVLCRNIFERATRRLSRQRDLHRPAFREHPGPGLFGSLKKYCNFKFSEAKDLQSHIDGFFITSFFLCRK